MTEKAPNGTDIVRFGDNAANISAFVAGQTDVLITGNIVAAKVISENPGKKIEPKFIMRESPCFIGVRQGKPTCCSGLTFSSAQDSGGNLTNCP
ncbi:MAG: hypothetical protein Ct9H300mP28_32220 [Pseudomonadota bacterium]|nr:MAG: hypothetical protein Ct9H300mP28_32220 [Pseudomonadota bacterium]